MSEPLRPIEKKGDESWKEQVERERRMAESRPAKAAPDPAPMPSAGQRAVPALDSAPAAGQRPVPALDSAPGPAPPRPEPPPAVGHEEPEPADSAFAVFLSSLSMQAMMALGELPIPGTDQRHEDLEQARYLIDMLGLLQQKTKGNLTLEEGQFLENALYELRLRYTQKIVPPMPPPPGGGRR